MALGSPQRRGAQRCPSAARRLGTARDPTWLREDEMGSRSWGCSPRWHRAGHENRLTWDVPPHMLPPQSKIAIYSLL